MILLPIGHERQTVQRLPWVTFGLIALCVLVYLYTGVIAPPDESTLNSRVGKFFKFYTEHPYLDMPPEMGQFLTAADQEGLNALKEGADRTTLVPDNVREEQQQLNDMAVDALEALNANPLRRWGYIPNDPHFFNIFSCIFLHEGFWHLFGNMLFLFLAGCALEDLWGRPLYLAFYLLSGVAATITHDLRFPSSAVPIIGASGAIAGLMGAFLVRLAKTRIKFFYFIWLFAVKSGTFEAPAFIMLPLWFLQQIIFASLTSETAGVAFWAHIGGFLFGILFALGMNMLMIEERYIAPAIEKKVTLVQNPLFLQAIALSERSEFPQALVQLQKVVRKEPNHLDAFMEMRTIYQKLEDADGFSRACGGILDIALRSRDSEMVLTNLEVYKNSSLKKVLPAKTLLGLGAFFEENQDEHGAAAQYKELTEHYPEDPLAMKAYSKLARLYIERLNERDLGEAAFWAAYDHPLANNEWRGALQQDMKRYQINPNRQPSAPAPQRVPHAAPVASVSSTVAAAEALPAEYELPVVLPVDESAPPAPPPPPPTPAQPGTLPWAEFDGAYSDWTVVACRIGKIGLKGLNLLNARNQPALLPWKKIRVVSAARVRSLSSGIPGARESLVLDLIVPSSGGASIVYRTTGKTLDFRSIFPGVEQTFFDAYENFLGILLSNSGAKCFPDRERCSGPVFTEYVDLDPYEEKLREALPKLG